MFLEMSKDVGSEEVVGAIPKALEVLAHSCTQQLPWPFYPPGSFQILTKTEPGE